MQQCRRELSSPVPSPAPSGRPATCTADAASWRLQLSSLETAPPPRFLSRGLGHKVARRGSCLLGLEDRASGHHGRESSGSFSLRVLRPSTAVPSPAQMPGPVPSLLESELALHAPGLCSAPCPAPQPWGQGPWGQDMGAGALRLRREASASPAVLSPPWPLPGQAQGFGHDRPRPPPQAQARCEPPSCSCSIACSRVHGGAAR